MQVLRACVFMLACAVLAGCANPQLLKRGDAEADSFWSGRLALQVEDSASQSFSAGFELKGSAQQGELALFTPLGGTLAVLSWQPGVAQLVADGKTRSFGSIDELVQQATGSVIPVAALFDWLGGRATEVPGWRADLSRRADGRVSAHRSDPLPAADLRVVLER
jgi:outer membrane lipoprotein LolB